MRVITSPGSNLPESLIRAYEIHVAPIWLIVDDERFDVRTGIDHAMIDGWLQRAKTHPYVNGNTVEEMVEAYRTVANDDREQLVITTSRRLIGTYDAAIAARSKVRDDATLADLKIDIADTKALDVGAGLQVLLAIIASRAGLRRDAVLALLERFAHDGAMFVVPQTLEQLVATGRAGIVRASIANLMAVSPIIAFDDGDMEHVGRVSRKNDIEEIVERVVAQLGEERAVWVGISHGSTPERAEQLEAGLRKRLDVQYVLRRPMTPSIYTYLGRGALGIFVYPIDRLPWTPHAPMPA